MSVPGKYFVLKGVFTPDECDEWVKEISLREFAPATINSNGVQVLDPDVRHHQRHMGIDHARADVIWERIKDDMKKEEPDAVELNPMLRYLRYSTGDFFAPHFDESRLDMKGNESIFTLILYLNDGYKGGHTVLLDEYNIKSKERIIPKKGDILLFEHEILHEGEHVTEGEKFVLRTDVMFPVMFTSDH